MWLLGPEELRLLWLLKELGLLWCWLAGKGEGAGGETLGSSWGGTGVTLLCLFWGTIHKAVLVAVLGEAV